MNISNQMTDKLIVKSDNNTVVVPSKQEIKFDGYPDFVLVAPNPADWKRLNEIGAAIIGLSLRMRAITSSNKQ